MYMDVHVKNRYSCHVLMKLKFVVCFLLGDSTTSEFYMPTFRNTVPSS